MIERLIIIRRTEAVLHKVSNGLASKLLIMGNKRAESKMKSKLLVQDTGMVLTLTETETWKL